MLLAGRQSSVCSMPSLILISTLFCYLTIFVGANLIDSSVDESDLDNDISKRYASMSDYSSPWTRPSRSYYFPKRYASMSYFYSPWRRPSRGRSSYRRSRKPWIFLPNTRCYRKQCNSNSDCCRRYNICDKYAKVCYDCWYGHPCKSSSDCCQRYPSCHHTRGCVVD